MKLLHFNGDGSAVRKGIVAEKLEIEPTDPILIRRRCVYDVNGRPVEYNIGYYRADSFSYTVESER